MLEQTKRNSDIVRLEWILYCTAFAAGAVDIIGFSNLGGVFASAMTGNLALLASYVAGALAAGLLSAHEVRQVVLVPPAAVAVALAAHRLLKRQAWKARLASPRRSAPLAVTTR